MLDAISIVALWNVEGNNGICYTAKNQLTIKECVFSPLLTYGHHEGNIYFAWFPFLLLAVDDLYVPDGEVV